PPPAPSSPAGCSGASPSRRAHPARRCCASSTAAATTSPSPRSAEPQEPDVFILAFFVLAVVSVPLCGGRLSALGEIRLRGLGVLVAALALQLLILEVLPDTLPLLVARGLHLLSYGLAAVFVVVNRRLPGLWVIALGGALNLL